MTLSGLATLQSVQSIQPYVADEGATAQFLASKGIPLTKSAMALFLNFVTDRYVDALGLLERHARNDYSADALSTSFPQFRGPAAKPTDTPSPWSLFDGWAAARKPAQASIERWTSVFRDLEETFAGSDARPLNADTAQEWARGKITDDRSPLTVKDTWVSAAHTIYEWAKRERLIKHNPFEGVHVTVQKKIKLRENDAFTAAEIKTILTAASAMNDSEGVLAAAKRWVPWLCAYSGARVGEITQLRGKDVERRGDFWAFRITPEAGTVKTGKAHVVPLHEHLIEQGFIKFVERCGKGPLFYKPRTITTPSDNPTSKHVRSADAGNGNGACCLGSQHWSD